MTKRDRNSYLEQLPPAGYLRRLVWWLRGGRGKLWGSVTVFVRTAGAVRHKL